MTPTEHVTVATNPEPLGRHEPTHRISTPELLSTLWIAVLLADVLRGIHETLRPGFVSELADQGTVYGNTVTDGALAVYGVMLGYFSALVVLSRVLPRRPNRWANTIGAAMMIAGVLVSWPKDPDDLIFGALQVAGSALIIVTCLRWTTGHSTPADRSGSTTARPDAQ